jgi:glycerol-3-phosphate dehydrogenase
MTGMKRDLAEAASREYDLIIIGGGIYGACLLLTASQAGKRALLIEKDDFGGATSFNNLRTIHGGLRYLQSLDFKRIFESVSERRWFFRNFPEFVRPLPCLMPLYGKGIYRPAIFQFALMLNDIFSSNRNVGVKKINHLPPGKIIGKEEVKSIFPQVDGNELKGGAIWYDGAAPDSPKILVEIIKWGCRLHGTALNYTEVDELSVLQGKVVGLRAVDKTDNKTYKFKAKKVVNCAGPWCRAVAAKFDKDYPELFKDSFAWNILFNRPALSSHALAVRPKRLGAQVYFIHHWKGLLFAGTSHSPWKSPERMPVPDEESVRNFIENLNDAVENLDLKLSDVLQIFPGLLPARDEGSGKIAVREVILDHGQHGGPVGLWSVSGVKFTTARLVAEKTLKILFAGDLSTFSRDGREPLSEKELGVLQSDWTSIEGNGREEAIKKIIQNESVVHLDDLMIRRTSLGDNPLTALNSAQNICLLFDWSEQEVAREMARLKAFYASRRISELG